jgi:exopolyphosphatase / guanosine-5'-triphosphate,3'-diphosphate pyrophosphatase
MILGAIDIGSNAARLLIADMSATTDSQQFTKLNLLRIPLKLGFDVFENGRIGKDKARMLLKTMKTFKLLLNVYEVEHFKIYATSAMRDAQNSKEIIRRVKLSTGLKIEVISGSEEANILYQNHLSANLISGKTQLFVDVGGGSTELTLYHEHEVIQKESFNVGTIRLLKQPKENSEWHLMKEFLKEHTHKHPNLQIIGSGGNINKVFSMSKTKDGKPLSLSFIQKIYKELEPMSVNERMLAYQLREDRAAVITPALKIFANILKWSQQKEIYVPKIGLADGIIKKLHQDLQNIHL